MGRFYGVKVKIGLSWDWIDNIIGVLVTGIYPTASSVTGDSPPSCDPAIYGPPEQLCHKLKLKLD